MISQLSRIVGLFILVTSVVACSHISTDAKQGLEKPVDCSTAQQDIQLLEKERASTGREVASGVKSIVPVAAVGNLLKGEYDDGVQVATGEYNNAIDGKINEIRVTCRLS